MRTAVKGRGWHQKTQLLRTIRHREGAIEGTAWHARTPGDPRGGGATLPLGGWGQRVPLAASFGAAAREKLRKQTNLLCESHGNRRFSI